MTGRRSAGKSEGMSEIDAWRAYARTLGFPLPAEAEKDYLQELLLREIYSRTGNEFVFRGGTAISKVCKSGRFSDDLDFVLSRESANAAGAVEAAINGMKSYFDISYSREEYRGMIEFSISVYGPLYRASGNPSAKQKISVDLNTYERPLLPTKALLVTPIYNDVRPYSVIVESEEELLADKVKAAIERREKHKTIFARDLYDAWFLIRKYGLKPNLGLVAEKMRLYGIKEFALGDFRNAVEEAKDYWKEELGRMLVTVPDYETARQELLQALR